MQRVSPKIAIYLVLWASVVVITTQGYNISGNLLSRHGVYTQVRYRRNDEVLPSILKIRYHHQGQMNLAVLEEVLDTTLVGPPLPVKYIASNREVSPENQPLLNPIHIPTFYHGVNSFSALTYFPRNRTLHGVLDQKVYVDNLPLNDANNPDIVKRFVHPILDEPEPPQNTRRRRGMDGKRKSCDDEKSVPRKRLQGEDEKKLLYPELFLIVDVTSEQIVPTLPDEYERAITYVLAYWNAIDMLFRTLKRTDVRINIAGILIGKKAELEASGLVNAEHIKTVGQRIFMLREMALDSLGTYFYYNDILRRDSYDFLIWMTSTILVDRTVWYQDNILLNRLKDYIGAAVRADCGGLHLNELRDKKILNRAIVMYDDKYSYYRTAARGLAHLMFVSDDNVEVLHDGVRSNCLPSNPMIQSSGIMDPSNKRVGDYLFWSYCSEIHLATYSRSKSSCCLLNYPSRIMNMPIPPYFTSIESQCECYGTQALDLMHYRRDICNKPLRCKEADGQIVRVAMPLDGTPCVSNEEEEEGSFCIYSDCI